MLIILLFPFVLFSQVPAYYSSIDFSQSPENLKTQLTVLITNTHATLIPYTSSNTDTWDVLKQSDLESQTSDNVLLIYGYNDSDALSSNDYSRNKDLSCHSSSCIGLWNREHVFAKSLANPSLDDSYPSAGTDVHNLRSCDSQMNSSRNNRIFQDDSGNAHITSIGNFYPGDEWKGDVARIIMYMYTRYPTQCEAINIGYGTLNNTSTMPNVFLDWNAQDPVSQFERDRNNIIYSAQGNRNPFIDNPYLATVIWGGAVAENTWNTLSVDEIDLESIKVYPTVTEDFVYIKDYKVNKEIYYSLYNTLGTEVLSSKITNIIDVSSLSNGLYMLKIKYNNTLINRKIIKI
ncbi:endonuclease [Oceanihabitans sp. 2_MG-2023]|uniref:endonuclease n=1 Tax=Oceanihabitans sp. 2_MG-2023 TaxID=3062661 RepID=UPI0026E45894|nr:endonuclease [Oceanihabitans sp. 2_MG-2023]MDO6598452.1 endonuclease [Oceanihabitans sp. 2_MG-2023]